MNKIALVLFVSLASFLACVKEEDKILATVGGEEIKVKDFLAVYLPKEYPSEEAELEAKKKTLDKLVEGKLMFLEAKRRGYDADTAIADSLRRARQEGLVEALYKTVVLDRAKVSDTELKRVYRVDQTLLHLKLIQVNSDTLANTVAQKISRGVSFDTLVATYSQHPSSRQGGDIGTISLAAFYSDKNTFNELTALKPGNASKPVKNQYGSYDIFYLVERSERENPPSFDEMREMLCRRLERQRERTLADESLKRFMEQVNLEYNQEGLNVFTKPKSDVTPEESGIWTIKLDGKVVDSVGSMMAMYVFLGLGDTLGGSADRIKQVAEGYGTNAALASIAAKRHLDRNPLVQQRVDITLARIMSARLYLEEVADKVSVTPEEVNAYYEGHLEDIYTLPERRKLSIVRNSEYSQIQQAHSLLTKGMPFAEVAERFSDYQESVARGGSIGFKTADDIAFKQFVQRAFTMQKGQISEPFQVFNGWGIVKVDEIAEGRVRPFEEVEASIEQRMRRDREQARLDEFLAAIRAGTPVDIDEELLLAVGKVKEKTGNKEETNQRP